ncbi:MAG: tRNA guanosine(15) transglycosylase TgtA [Candidatus Thorarchaeota archaeon]|nr:tRNA guanosine(15) transglycosylase TgtA [Candidatus Thorarchaeota archaeon]
MGQFEIRVKDGLARLGRFSTKHGTVITPLLMPVVHPGKSEIRPKELVEDFGFQMVITNSYIIRSHERFRDKALEDGVHGLLDFEGPIMTDSGTFQMYFHDLPEEEIDPLEIVRFQRGIGADIGTILDAFSDPSVARAQVEKDVQTSLERARISVPEKGEMMLAGTVQGGVYKDLRETSASALARLDFDVHPIGGVVPFMESYRYSDIVRIALASKHCLPPQRPVHLFGCGHPMLFAQAALLGCDFFDSASYAKFADSGRMLFPDGTMHLQNLRELPCECPVCSSFTAEELKSMKKEERALLLMKHNLYVSVAEMRRVRQAIQDGKLFELAAYRARGHPSLMEALEVMLDILTARGVSEPVGKTSSIFYTGTETGRRPEIEFFHRRILERFPVKTARIILLVPHHADHPFSDTAQVFLEEGKLHQAENLQVVFVTPYGAVPWELEHVHPAQQCIFPQVIDDVTLSRALARVEELISQLRPRNVFWLSRDTPVDILKSPLSQKVELSVVERFQELKDILPVTLERDSWLHRKLRAIAAYQWKVELDSLAGLEVVLSKSTGKIRHIRYNGDILFTVIPQSGLLAPTFKGGEALLTSKIDEMYKVGLDSDAAEFVEMGKSALAKFVVKASASLLAGEEVLLMNPEDQLIGVGRAVLNGTEMLAFDRGVAVATRHSKQ